METMEILQSIVSVATVEIVFVVVVFKLILGNYQPPIQQSIQAFVCVIIGVALALAIEQNVYSFMTGIISAGIGFYGGTYVNEIRGIRKELNEDKEESDKK